ncbi:MAG: hypothetical protein R2773_05430 [Flavobacteriaceae bacterium]
MSQKISSIAKSSVLITAKRIYDDGTEVGSSVMSGFLWLHNNKPYVITNWHNVTGKNPETDENIGSFCPNQLIIELKYDLPTEEEGYHKVMGGVRNFDLYNRNLEKNWIEHPEGRKVDVVALPINLDLPEKSEPHYMNLQDYQKDWLPDVGDDCFIVGYPEGFSGPFKTSIWKRGSVATLPLLDYDEKPIFLLDTIGNKGLSGAAVIGRGNGIFDKSPGRQISGDAIIGTWYNFVGIYSGRLSDVGIGSQLGRVWKKSVIDEIFQNI